MERIVFDGAIVGKNGVSKSLIFNTFIVPSPVTVSDKTATIQDKSGIIAYLSDIPTGTAINNIYNADGQLQANRIIDGNGRTYGPTFADLDQFQIRFTNVIYLECDALVIGGINSVSIATPNTIATLGKVGQVLTPEETPSDSSCCPQ